MKITICTSVVFCSLMDQPFYMKFIGDTNSKMTRKKLTRNQFLSFQKFSTTHSLLDFPKRVQRQNFGI